MGTGLGAETGAGVGTVMGREEERGDGAGVVGREDGAGVVGLIVGREDGGGVVGVVGRGDGAGVLQSLSSSKSVALLPLVVPQGQVVQVSLDPRSDAL